LLGDNLDQDKGRCVMVHFWLPIIPALVFGLLLAQMSRLGFDGAIPFMVLFYLLGVRLFIDASNLIGKAPKRAASGRKQS